MAIKLPLVHHPNTTKKSPPPKRFGSDSGFVDPKSTMTCKKIKKRRLSICFVSWISLFIALAPMLGFMGTVIGMIGAFDAIEAAGDINPSLVAGGIKVALLTTVFGLITAIILQIFYNLIVAITFILCHLIKIQL